MRRNDEVARTEGDRAITFPKLQGKTHFHIHMSMQNVAQELRKQLAMRVSWIQCCSMCAANALLCSVQLLRQIVSKTHCLDGRKLRFQEVCMLFFIQQEPFE